MILLREHRGAIGLFYDSVKNLYHLRDIVNILLEAKNIVQQITSIYHNNNYLS